MTAPASTVVVMMGVSGSGKTTVGEALASRLGWPFQEGDDFHSAANIAKMKAAIPLTDADRAPWLARIEAWIDGQLSRGLSGVITCSALKRTYRRQIIGGRPNVRLVYLHGRPETTAGRLARRQGHFMSPALLPSQLADLEPPAPDEAVITVDIDAPRERQVDRLVEALRAENVIAAPRQ
ncbi:MAG: gntK [Caulobacteraceae bacterium]|nr:gntK [Caulobacteraceae bacterium]